jgi:hypothetical protein
VSDVNRYELSRDMKPEEWPPVLVDELDYELMKRAAFQAQEMAKEIAAENATLKARLAEAERLLRWAEAMVREFPETYLISVDSFLKDAARADGAGEGGK